MRRWASLLALPALLASRAAAAPLDACRQNVHAAINSMSDPEAANNPAKVDAMVRNAAVICAPMLNAHAALMKSENLTDTEREAMRKDGEDVAELLGGLTQAKQFGVTDQTLNMVKTVHHQTQPLFKEPEKPKDAAENTGEGLAPVTTRRTAVSVGNQVLDGMHAKKSTGKLPGGGAAGFDFRGGAATTEQNEQFLDQRGGGTSQDYTKVAEQYSKSNKPADARRAADKAVQQNPKDPVALSSRARIRAQAGDAEGALADARAALKSDPNNELARFIVGNRDQLAASGSKLKSLKLDFGAAREADDLGPAPDREERSPGGETYAAKTIAFTHLPVNPAAQKFLDSARIKLGVGDRTGALMDVTRAVGADPESAAPLLLRARISRESGNAEGALDDANRALALAPEDPNALRERALAFIDLGRYSEALADLERAMKLDPNSGVAYLYRAMIYEKLGRASEALEDLATAVRLEPALKPLAEEVAARLKAPAKERSARVDRLGKKMVRMGTVGASLLLMLLGLLGSAKGRAALTTTAKTLFGSSAAPTVADVPQAPDLPAGAVLGGLYRIERELGRGGMGVVYEATDTGLQRRVAIKRLQRDARTTQADFDRFLQEARTVAKLRHPRVAEIHNLLVDGDLYLVFEYLEGETLDRALERRLRLPLADARRVIADVAAAVGFAHQQKVIHRDLKPSNVMVETSGSAKVMDFGIAHQANAAATVLTRTSASGTPPYMAPEQAMGSVSKASDLYALAIMTYELVVGRRPFEGPDFLEQKLGRAFLPPSQVVPGLPKGLDAFFQRALDPDPTKRHPSAEEFLRAFDGACA